MNILRKDKNKDKSKDKKEKKEKDPDRFILGRQDFMTIEQRRELSHCLINFNPATKQFSLSQTVKELLANLQGETYIMSVCGNPVTGKSTILNFLSSMLNCTENISTNLKYKAYFEVGKGLRSTTQGIDFLIVRRSNNKNVIVIDLEGDNDPARQGAGVWFFSNLISLATGIAHVNLYNYNRLPQQSFLDYFRTCKQQEQSRNLHPDFKSKYFFVKRDHTYTSEKNYLIEQMNFKNEFEKEHADVCEKGGFYMLPTPPEHIISKRCKDSCLKTTGIVCEKCIDSPFLFGVRQVYNAIDMVLDGKNSKGYANGQAVLEIMENILEMNQKDLPFSDDIDHISKIRQKKLQDDYNQFSQTVLKIQPEDKHKNLFTPLEEMPLNHISDDESSTLQEADRTRKLVASKIIQWDYLLPIMNQFIEERLFDDGFIIFSQAEATIIEDTYSSLLQIILKDLQMSLEEYEIFFRLLMRYFEQMEKEAQKIFQELDIDMSNVKFNLQSKGAVAVSTIISSALLATVGRELAVRIFGGILLTGGTLGVALAVYTFFDGLHKYKKYKEAKTNNVKWNKIFQFSKKKKGPTDKEKEQLALVMFYLQEKLKQYQEKQANISAIAQNSLKFDIFDQFHNIIQKKLKQEEITEQEKAQLLDSVKQVDTILTLLKESLDMSDEDMFKQKEGDLKFEETKGRKSSTDSGGNSGKNSRKSSQNINLEDDEEEKLMAGGGSNSNRSSTRFMSEQEIEDTFVKVEYNENEVIGQEEKDRIMEKKNEDQFKKQQDSLDPFD